MKSKVLCIEFARRMIVDSIYSSANVEGLGTTFTTTECILENIPVKTTRSEVQFIINMKYAWNFLLDNLDYNNCFMLLRQFNIICGDQLFKPTGELRTSSVKIGETKWVPDLPNRDTIISDIKRLNSIDDAEAKAIAYFCYITRCQMFIDGNKRVAQLMANKILIEEGIGILSIPVDKLGEFKILLVEYYESANPNKLFKFLKDFCIHRI